MTFRFGITRISGGRAMCPATRAVIWALLCASLTIPFAHASAQTLAQQTRVVGSDDRPSHIISANPFLPLFGYFAGEFEQRISPSVALALAGSHTRFDRTRYTNLEAKARLYPSETALRGFNIAASLGIARIGRVDEFGDCVLLVPFEGSSSCGAQLKPFTTGSFAIEVGYQWLLGPSRVTAVTLGGGAKRYLGSDAKFDQINRVIPTARLSIGYAF